MRILTTVSIAFAVAAAVLWQPRAGFADEGEGYGGVSFGGQFLKLDELNSELGNASLAEVKDRQIIFGGMGYGLIKGRLILGGEGFGFLQQSVSSDSIRGQLAAGAAFFNVGYVVAKRHGVRVYPIVGIGGGGISLDLKKREMPPDFQDVLGNPAQKASLGIGGLAFSMGLGADWFLKLSEKSVCRVVEKDGKKEEEQSVVFGGVLVGIRAGYVLMPGVSGWSSSGAEVYNGPEVDLSGPYVRLTFGGGGGKSIKSCGSEGGGTRCQ